MYLAGSEEPGMSEEGEEVPVVGTQGATGEWRELSMESLMASVSTNYLTNFHGANTGSTAL